MSAAGTAQDTEGGRGAQAAPARAGRRRDNRQTAERHHPPTASPGPLGECLPVDRSGKASDSTVHASSEGDQEGREGREEGRGGRDGREGRDVKDGRGGAAMHPWGGEASGQGARRPCGDTHSVPRRRRTVLFPPRDASGRNRTNRASTPHRAGPVGLANGTAVPRAPGQGALAGGCLRRLAVALPVGAAAVLVKGAPQASLQVAPAAGEFKVGGWGGDGAGTAPARSKRPPRVRQQ